MVSISHPDSAVAAVPVLDLSWRPELIRHAHRIVRDEAQAQDIVQEALRRLLVASPAPDNPRAWLFRVVRNLSLHWISKHHSLVAVCDAFEPADPAPSPDAHAELNEIARFFERELPRLSPLEQRILHRIAFEDATVREIADTERLSKSTVFRIVQQLRHKLGKAFVAEFGEPLQAGSPTVHAQFGAWFLGLETVFGPALRNAIHQSGEGAVGVLDRVFRPLENALSSDPSFLSKIGATLAAGWAGLLNHKPHVVAATATVATVAVLSTSPEIIPTASRPAPQTVLLQPQEEAPSRSDPPTVLAPVPTPRTSALPSSSPRNEPAPPSSRTATATPSRIVPRPLPDREPEERPTSSRSTSSLRTTSGARNIPVLPFPQTPVTNSVAPDQKDRPRERRQVSTSSKGPTKLASIPSNGTNRLQSNNRGSWLSVHPRNSAAELAKQDVPAVPKPDPSQAHTSDSSAGQNPSASNDPHPSPPNEADTEQVEFILRKLNDLSKTLAR